jgi:hypothetical protein
MNEVLHLELICPEPIPEFSTIEEALAHRPKPNLGEPARVLHDLCVGHLLTGLSIQRTALHFTFSNGRSITVTATELGVSCAESDVDVEGLCAEMPEIIRYRLPHSKNQEPFSWNTRSLWETSQGKPLGHFSTDGTFLFVGFRNAPEFMLVADREQRTGELLLMFSETC